jgi:hypothetical protein
MAMQDGSFKKIYAAWFEMIRQDNCRFLTACQP